MLGVVETNMPFWVREALFSMPVRQVQACCRFFLEVVLVRSNKAGRDRDLIRIAHEAYLREVSTRECYKTPLYLVLVNAHVLAEIVVATERLITFRERMQKR